MNRKTLTISFLSLFCFAIGCPVFAEQAYSEQHSINYEQYTDKRQIVDQLLEDALVSFKSPERVSNAGFTAKIPTNMEVVTEKLLKAYTIEPYRTDLLISAVNAQVYNKNIDNALTLFKKAILAAPDDIDLNTYLAVWTRYKGDYADFKKYMKKLAELAPNRQEDLSNIFKLIDDTIEKPLTDTIQTLPGEENHAIITLGYALNPDGSMHEILIKRLEKTLELAKASPSSIIILTGGVPQNHNTEGHLMAEWLIAKGINPKRIIEENYATNTVENAIYSSYALAKHNVSYATIISSASHIRRGQVVFTITSWQTGPHNIKFNTLAFPDKPLEQLQKPSAGELIGIYRDALRAYGMWSYRSYPVEFR